jgi:DNA repair exonuclease SbcCD ATPase subunit
MTVGLTKLNIKTTSAKSKVAANLGMTTRSSSSYGIFAQRTVTGSGIHFNNKLYNSPSISNARYLLNANRSPFLTNVGHKCNHSNSSDNTMNKFMMATMAAGIVAELTKEASDTIKSIKTEKSENKNVASNLTENNVSSSLKDLTKQVDTANKKVDTFNSNYSKTSGLREAQKTITDVKSKLTQAGVNNVNLTDLNLTDLNLTSTSSLSDIEGAINKIQNTDIASIDTYLGNLGTAIGAIDAQLTSLNNDKTNVAQNTDKIGTLQAAKEKLETLRDKQLPTLKTNLTKQKTELEGIKKAKAEAMDKVYTQAQTDDKQIGENNEKIDKLKMEIAKETDDKKKKKLIKQYNGLADSNKKLQTELQALPQGTTNSKGETLALTNSNTAVIAHYNENNSGTLAQNLIGNLKDENDNNIT